MKIIAYLTLLFLFTTASKGSHAFLHDYLSQQAQEIKHRPTRTKVLKGARCADKVAQWCESDEEFKKTPIAPTVQTLVNLEGMLDESGNLIPDAVDMATHTITTWDGGKKGCNTLYMGTLQFVAQAVTSLERYQMNGGPPSSGGGQWLALGCAVAAAGAAYLHRHRKQERKDNDKRHNRELIDFARYAAIAQGCQSGWSVYFSAALPSWKANAEEQVPLKFKNEDQTEDKLCLSGPIAMMETISKENSNKILYSGQAKGLSYENAAFRALLTAGNISLGDFKIKVCASGFCRGHSVSEQCVVDLAFPFGVKPLRDSLSKQWGNDSLYMCLHELGIRDRIESFLGPEKIALLALEEGQKNESWRFNRPKDPVFLSNSLAFLSHFLMVDLYNGVGEKEVKKVLALADDALEANYADCWSERSRVTRHALIDQINQLAPRYRLKRQRIRALVGALERWKRLKHAELMVQGDEPALKACWYKKTKNDALDPTDLSVRQQHFDNPKRLEASLFSKDYTLPSPQYFMQASQPYIGEKTLVLRGQINHWFFNQWSLRVFYFVKLTEELQYHIGSFIENTETEIKRALEQKDLKEVLALSREKQARSLGDEREHVNQLIHILEAFGVEEVSEDWVLNTGAWSEGLKALHTEWQETKNSWLSWPFHRKISEKDWLRCIQEAAAVDRVERNADNIKYKFQFEHDFFNGCRRRETNPNIQDMPTGEQVLSTAHVCREGITSRVLIDMALDFVAGKKMTWLRSSAVGGGEQSPPSTVVEVAPETAGAAAGAGSLLEGDGVRRR